ncbi:hypothetical protein ACFQX4_18135 [Roseomonas sp. GCM10028921]
MRQDTDVARMAAALGTPSLRYRSFGNEPVRNPRQVPGEPRFDILGDALAGVSDLSPDTVLGVPAEAAEAPAPRSLPEARTAQPLPAPHPGQANPAPLQVVRPAQETVRMPVAPAFQAMRPAAPKPSPVAEAGGQNLLQRLLAAPARAQQPAPAELFLGPVALAMQGAAARPVHPGQAGLSQLAPASGTGRSSPGIGSGSSLLDALMGYGTGNGAPAVHYPLLDALGETLRTGPAEPSPRQWAASRVDIPLPELLRRVAAGVRSHRSAA